MSYESLESNFNADGLLKFRLYSLDYIIRKNVNGVEIYALLYPKDKKVFTSFTDLMMNYTIYNISLNNYVNKITVI